MPAWVRLKPDTTYDLVWAGESRTLVQRRDRATDL